MIWIEMVCDRCMNNPFGERYKKGSVERLKRYAKQDGWKTVNGKIYCPNCYKVIKGSTKGDKEMKYEGYTF